MVSLFSLPDPDIFMDSSKTVYLSEPLSMLDGLLVIPVTAIHSVILMFPEMCIAEGGPIVEMGKFSLMRHAFLKLAEFSNGKLFEEEDDNLNKT
jgi:hypothetical protein